MATLKNKFKLIKCQKEQAAQPIHLAQEKDLIGMTHKGHEIVDASQRFIYLNNGERVERAGNRVEHDIIEAPTGFDHDAWMQETAGDDL